MGLHMPPNSIPSKGCRISKVRQEWCILQIQDTFQQELFKEIHSAELCEILPHSVERPIFGANLRLLAPVFSSDRAGSVN